MNFCEAKYYGNDEIQYAYIAINNEKKIEKNPVPTVDKTLSFSSDEFIGETYLQLGINTVTLYAYATINTYFNENPNIVRNDGVHNYFMNENGRTIQSLNARIFIRRKK